MNRRDFFRRTIPAVAVTVAASQCGWSLGTFKRLLRRVLKGINESREAEIIRQLKYQAKMAMRAMERQIAQQFYGINESFYAALDEPNRLIPVEYKMGFAV